MNDHAGHSHSEIVGYFGPVSVSAVEEVDEEDVAEEVADEVVVHVGVKQASQHSADRMVCEVSARLPHQRPGATPGRT